MFTNLTKYESLIPRISPGKLEDLDPDLRLYSDGKIDVWYSPIGKRIDNPSIWILGITPGWNQMRIAYEEASLVLRSGASLRQAVDCAKPKVAFAGSMRKNLISMLDAIDLNSALGLTTTEKLFGSDHLRTGSILRYPVFNNGRNYTGSSPFPTKHKFLKKMLDDILSEELETVSQCLIIPLGKTVEKALEYSTEKGCVDPSRILSNYSGVKQAHPGEGSKGLDSKAS